MGIRILDAATVGQISAGEVVERPSSAVKELMENALDAHSTSVTVEIRAGGIEYLRVTDNGSGIAPEEVRLAFENHATSKITSAKSLADIRTLGFRGEALPSIAAVSKVTCTTRQKGASSGAKLIVEGGRFVSLGEAGCPEGTTITVEDMFYNVPVRRAFLKKPAYEAGVAAGVVAAIALGNPGVAVRLIVNGKTQVHTFGDGNLRHAALAVYGKDIASKLTEIDQMEGAFRISGLIGAGDCARPTRNEQHFFINGRVVRCQMLSQALESACAGRVTIGMHPVCMLNLTLPPHAVDVNVHPNKLEVRFRDEASVRAAADWMFTRAFQGEHLLDIGAIAERAKPIAPEIKLSIDRRTEGESEREKTEANKEKTEVKKTETEVSKSPSTTKKPDQVSFSEMIGAVPSSFTPSFAAPPVLNESLIGWAPIAEPKATPQPLHAPAPAAQPPSALQEAPEFRVIGVAFNTYLLVESGDNLLLIDQHAAHERILYEEYLKKLEGPGASQQLLTPVIVPASAREIAQVEDEKALIEEAGFDVEAFGERELAVRAVPFILGKAEVGTFFMSMLEKLDQLKYATRDRRKAELIQMACKHAVKGGDRLSASEIEELIAAMKNTESPATCPHGRPVLRVMTRNELERMFKRQQ